MKDNKLEMLMVKFLKRNFPITKIKKYGSKRFRRGIYIVSGFTGKSDQKYHINDKKDIRKLYSELFKILENVFGVGVDYINPILINHLNLK